MTVSAQQTSMVIIKGTEIATTELLEEPFEPLTGKLSVEIAHPSAEAATSDIIPAQTPVEEKSRIRHLTVHSWQPGAPSEIVVHSWQPDTPSRIIVHSWQPGTPSRILTHGLQTGG